MQSMHRPQHYRNVRRDVDFQTFKNECKDCYSFAIVPTRNFHGGSVLFQSCLEKSSECPSLSQRCKLCSFLFWTSQVMILGIPIIAYCTRTLCAGLLQGQAALIKQTWAYLYEFTMSFSSLARLDSAFVQSFLPCVNSPDIKSWHRLLKQCVLQRHALRFYMQPCFANERPPSSGSSMAPDPFSNWCFMYFWSDQIATWSSF